MGLSVPPAIRFSTFLALLFLAGCHGVRMDEPPPDGMVLIPAGEFIMGASAEDGLIGIDVGVDQTPRHQVYLKSYFIDQYEATIGEYRRYIAETGARPPEIWKPFPGRLEPKDAYALFDISYPDAEAYCRWKGKRLPTEAEWEKAAKGTDGRKWPWGDDLSKGATNTLGSGPNWVAPPGSFLKDVSPYGLYDMGGNVMEWTSSWYLPYPGSDLKRDAFGEKYKVLRGGSWTSSLTPFGRTTHRLPVLSWIAQPDFGVRCAKDAK